MSSPITLDTLSIFDDIFIPPPEEPKQPSDGKQYIINEKRIDKLTVKRTRVEITPAVCDTCGLDLLAVAHKQNKVATKEYNELPDDYKVIFTQVVARHKAQLHSESEKLIVSQKPKQWLSGRGV